MKIVSSQTNIRNAIFDQRSTRPPEVGVSRWHRQTNGHGDSRTNSAQWGRVGEKVGLRKEQAMFEKEDAEEVDGGR